MFTTPSIVYSLKFNCEFSWSLRRFTLSNYYYINQSRESKIEDFIFHGFHSFILLHKLFNKIPLLLNSMTWNNIYVYNMRMGYISYLFQQFKMAQLLNGQTDDTKTAGKIDRTYPIWITKVWKFVNFAELSQGVIFSLIHGVLSTGLHGRNFKFC